MTEQEAYAIGREAYTYFYPLVLMDATRRQATNTAPGQTFGRGPMNLFTHARTFPPASFRDVVRPNFDTLYSIAWLDLTQEPIIVSVPDTGGRYYLLQVLDMWTDVFASLGKRTTGTAAASFAFVAPGWTGTLPDGVARIDAPTPFVWTTGRTQTNGAEDHEAVHAVQDGYALSPLSRWGRPAEPVRVVVDPVIDMQLAPMIQIDRMDAAGFFGTAAELLKVNPPHISDQPVIARMRHTGIEPGRSFDLANADPAVRRALERAAPDAAKAIRAKLPTLARIVNGWQMNMDSIGVYGAYYLKRAGVALLGLGANLPEDAVYPISLCDAAGEPLSGAADYVLRFAKSDMPPVSAFWSVTLYDQDGFPTENALGRNALGDRDSLRYGRDGSLDLYIQAGSRAPPPVLRLG